MSSVGNPNEPTPTLDSPSNVVLVKRLAEQHYPTIYAYCYRLCGNKADAEDICQQTFLQVLRSWEQLTDTSRALPWMYTIARRLFWRRLRKESLPGQADNAWQRREVALEFDDLTAYPTSQPIGAIDVEQSDWIQHAMDQLQVDHRVVVVMHYFEHLSYQEIADELGIPMGTVMSRLSRAKSYLRQALSLQES